MSTCLQCGEKLPPLNRTLLMCRRCAQADEQRTRNYTGESGSDTPLIYVSYRWADSGPVSDLIYRRLVDRFGPNAVVRDIDRLALGVPYPRLLERTLRRAIAVLFVIGPTWHTSRDALGRTRLDDPTDWVRREIDTALRLSAPVILVNTAVEAFPPADLPASLSPLKSKRCIEIGPDPESGEGFNVLLAKLAAMLGSPTTGEVELSREDALENSLLRLDHQWQDQREHFVGPWGNPPSEIHLLTVFLFGLVALASGVRGMVTAELPDLVCLSLIAVGIVWPTYRGYKYGAFRQVERAYEVQRASLQAALQTTQRQGDDGSVE